VFATFHTPLSGINRVTDDTGDRVVDTPCYKVAAVAIEPLVCSSVAEHEGRPARAGVPQ
jgi:hypothetical protein